MAHQLGHVAGRALCDGDALGVSIGIVGWKDHWPGIHLQEGGIRRPPIEQAPVPQFSGRKKLDRTLP